MPRTRRSLRRAGGFNGDEKRKLHSKEKEQQRNMILYVHAYSVICGHLNVR